MLDERMKAELKRIRRISDMLCTAHAGLRDEAERNALCLDAIVLALSAWVAALAFVDPAIAQLITPGNLPPTMWIGMMGLAAFVLTLVQMRWDLRGRAEAHRRALDAYAGVKRDAARLLSDFEAAKSEDFGRLVSQYDLASAMGVAIPEDKFAREKQRHLLKVRTSRYLDERPSTNVRLLRLQWALRDNLASFKGGGASGSTGRGPVPND